MLKAEGKIEDQPTIKKILKHLGLFEIHNHDPPVEKSNNFSELTYLPVRDSTCLPADTHRQAQTGDDSCSQIPAAGYWIQ